MAWTAVHTWAAAVLTVAKMNEQVRDNIAFLKANIALEAAVELTLSGDAVAKTKAYHTITVEGGVGSGADDLATCTGGSEGEILFLKATTTGANDTVTVKDGTGADTFILSGADFIMAHVDDRIMLIHNGTEWVELSRSDNS